jgi:hypothetical protein
MKLKKLVKKALKKISYWTEEEIHFFKKWLKLRKEYKKNKNGTR